MVNIFAILSIYWRSIDLVNSCSIDFVFQIPTVKKNRKGFDMGIYVMGDIN